MHDIWKFEAKFHTAFVLISALGISTVGNDISPLLGYINPSQAMYQG